MLTNPEPPETRDRLDRYYTPEWCTRALLENVDIKPRAIIWEPCAGVGSISRALTDAGHRVICSDIDPASQPHHGGQVADFIQTSWCADWIITNPPYQVPSMNLKASDFVAHALVMADRVAMLLRVTWLEPCGDRLRLLRLRPPSTLIVLPRVSFGGPGGKGGNDSATSAWFVWDRHDGPNTEIRLVSKADVSRLNGQLDLFQQESADGS